VTPDARTVRKMRAVKEGEVPVDGGTAVQEAVDRPVFRGNGEYDYVCVSCGSLLASGWDPQYMTRRVRVRCAGCATINIAAELPVQPARRPRSGG
jgi:DNA-directed RNA polymerase subunit RPC12/RpoP